MDIKRVGASGADLGALEWAKGARKTDLHVIACFLIAKQDYGVFLERFAHCAIGSVVGCHIDQIDPAHLCGEPRPQRDESHDRPSGWRPASSSGPGLTVAARGTRHCADARRLSRSLQSSVGPKLVVKI